MFSGLIQYRGELVGRDGSLRDGMRLRIRCEGIERERPQPKDSIAIDGVCLTASRIEDSLVAFDVIPETLRCSTLGERAIGEAVNVEYALRLGDRLGGHLVYGHVDAAARVIDRVPEGQGARIRIETPPMLRRMVAPKGNVAIDGVSLTIAQANTTWFDVALIPETLARTTLGSRQAGSRVNVEIDLLARYVQAFVDSGML